MKWTPGVAALPDMYPASIQPYQCPVAQLDRNYVVIWIADRPTRLDGAAFRYEVAAGANTWGKLVIMGDGVTNPALGTVVTDELNFNDVAGVLYNWTVKEDVGKPGWHPVLEANEVLAVVWDTLDTDPPGGGTGSGTGDLKVPTGLVNCLVKLRMDEKLG